MSSTLSTRTVKIYANAYDRVARAAADAAQDTADGLPPLVVTPASGATLTLTDLTPVYVNNASVLAALTIRLPAAVPDKENAIEIGFARPVTALTVQNPGGTNVAGAPANAYGPGSAHVYRYVDAVGWVYWK